MLSMDVARARAAVLRAIRRFFDDRGYLETDVPTLAPQLIPEAHIEVFETRLVDPFADAASADAGARRYLTPSPEIWMKRLLAQGSGSIYYLGKAYRNAESTSRMHRPEFTMLEWYTVEADAASQISLTVELLDAVAAAANGSLAGNDETSSAAPGGGFGPAERMTVAQAFGRFAGVEPDFGATSAMRQTAEALGLSVGLNESEEDLYQRILLTFVEPRLPEDRPVFLTDYPALVPTLARRRGPVAERWELYLAGMEIANCYGEERDRAHLESFLRREAERKAAAHVPHPPAWSILEFADAPPCAGVALGVDRLLMAALGVRDIGGVIFFP